MAKKKKGLTVKAKPETTEILVKKLRSFNRIISHSNNTVKVGDAIVESLKVTGVLYKKHLRVK